MDHTESQLDEAERELIYLQRRLDAALRIMTSEQVIRLRAEGYLSSLELVNLLTMKGD